MDIKIRATSQKHNVKIAIVDLSESMLEITNLQETNPIASIVLAKTTAANALLGVELKNGETMSSNIVTSDGLVKKIITEYQNNKVRSYIQNPNFDANLLVGVSNPLVAALGQIGTLVTCVNLNLKEPYISKVDLIDGTIDGDYMNYLRVSNQINSFITTKVKLDSKMKIEKVVGILVQLFPNHTNEDINYLETKIGNSQYIADILLNSTNYESVIKEIVEDAIILENKELKFECTCSKEKTFNSIKILGNEELKKIIAEQKNLEVVCEFCNKKYQILFTEIEQLLH
ncbi:heat shock protein 33 [Williamsoniiplasma somnilux]|uniref:Heat shock protein 33 n=1 Tax=Williamsoniiplasma somnilux TaxID=215578 RepID=A0A2K8NZ48_9MOLU|nr:Hsp33 family molecular chaperone HslO [Williamsoniiplasma somnilux]ATZ19099.1 heat shock protein 33 [Williamsoniiplasma somnilux]